MYAASASQSSAKSPIIVIPVKFEAAECCTLRWQDK